LPLAHVNFPLAIEHLGFASADSHQLIEEMQLIAANEEEERLLGDKLQDLGWGKGRLESLVSKLIGTPKSSSSPKSRSRDADQVADEPGRSEEQSQDDE
jgi:hypothetical protein